VHDGPMLLKHIVALTYVDTRATASHIRDTLIDMGAKLDELGENIEQFNAWVRTQMIKLTARGEECQDLMLYLMKAYQKAPDEEFRLYIKDKKRDYEEGAVDLTAEALMTYAANKYNARVQSKEWSKPTQEQADIVALTAQLQVLNKQLSNKKNENLKKGQKEKGKGKGKKENKKKSDTKKWDWKLIPPKDNEDKTKVVNGKTYYFCPNHKDKGMWTLHKPSECSQQKQTNKKDKNTNSSSVNVHKAVTFQDDTSDSGSDSE
jgi:hypothetical protein